MKKLEINYKKSIYPSILVAVIIIVIIAAFLTIRFLTLNINSSLDPDESVLNAKLTEIDLKAYELTAKKLGIQYPSLLEDIINQSPQ